MFRIIKEFKPRWIIAENVRGIINIQDGVVFEGVHADLESQGYETQTFNIPAAGVGAPHRRERVWIVANSRRTIRGKQSTRNKESIGPETSQETKRSADSDSVARSSEREKIMANSKRVYVQGQHDGSGKEQSRRGGWWEVEPNVGRVADGLPGRVHRLKGLGNSIVPQIAEEIGKAILKAEHD
jgi:DNA (cytosine-5)-methyltransferase 1